MAELDTEISIDRARLRPAHRVRVPRLSLRVSERKIVLLIIDTFLVNAALWLAVRLCTEHLRTPEEAAVFSKWFIALTIVWLLSALLFDCYNLARAASGSASLRSILSAGFIAVLIYTFIPYFTPPLDSRGLIFVMAALTVGSLAAWRLVYARVFVQPWFQQRALIIGAGPASRTLLQAMRAAPADANPYRGTGYHILGIIDDDISPSEDYIDGIPVLGDHTCLEESVHSLRIDQLIIAITQHQIITDQLFDALLRCRESGVRVLTMPTVYERLTGRVPIDHAGHDLHLIMPMDDDPGERAYRIVKRLIDLFAALAGLLLLGMVSLPIALLNHFGSPGPLLYHQQRVGRGGKVFNMIKFRSMRPDAEEGVGAIWASEHDDRITPIGHALRRTRLDELPQFINVLRGEMSLIGPRPERPEFVSQLAETIPFYRARHAVKPGITGWAQIRYHYGNSAEDAHTKQEYDLYYVKHISLFLDLIIILQTIPVILLGKGT
jgi:exopolysaccharide biosynthesis polyprenyl glycosylphosphotransferase